MPEIQKAFCGSFENEYDSGDRRYNLIKEEISYAYINSLTAFLGAELKKNGRLLDNDGIDLSVRLPQNRLGTTKNPKPGLDIQMKCTSSPEYDVSKKYLNFDLSIEVYNKMKTSLAMNPSIFMILILPKSVNEWVIADDEKLSIRRNALWYNPANTDLKPSLDQKTIRLKIPLAN